MIVLRDVNKINVDVDGCGCGYKQLTKGYYAASSILLGNDARCLAGILGGGGVNIGSQPSNIVRASYQIWLKPLASKSLASTTLSDL